jgi:hypothetical protein
MVGNALGRARSLVRRLVHPAGDLQLVRKELQRLTKQVARLEDAQRSATALAHRADRTSAQLKLIALLDRRQRADIERLPALLDEQRIAEHTRRAVAAAPLLVDPYEHIIVDRVLPDAVYELLVRAIPPVEFFTDRDRIKQDLTFPMELGPALSAMMWEYMDNVIARQVIRPAVLEKFQAPLQRHFESVFGTAFVERASSLPQAVHGGRLMLRRPGYHLGPHRDPKRALLTCLMYLARDGDSETYGTQIFRVQDDVDAGYKQTYYPESEGRRCELVKVVPFKPNTMLVSLNWRGAHGATIPADAPADLERYAYQFYVAPHNEALSALIKSLPPAQRAMWRNRAQVAPEQAAAPLLPEGV